MTKRRVWNKALPFTRYSLLRGWGLGPVSGEGRGGTNCKRGLDEVLSVIVAIDMYALMVCILKQAKLLSRDCAVEAL